MKRFWQPNALYKLYTLLIFSTLILIGLDGSFTNRVTSTCVPTPQTMLGVPATSPIYKGDYNQAFCPPGYNAELKGNLSKAKVYLFGLSLFLAPMVILVSALQMLRRKPKTQ